MQNTARLTLLIAALALVALAAGDATPARGASFTVNATHDAVDAAPGDGVCADTGGACTLRAAIEETNALPGADAIAVPGGDYAGKVTVTDSVTINGAGAAATTIRGQSPTIGSVITIGTCGQSETLALTIVITGVSITAGLFQGGGLLNCGHALNLTAVAVRGNGGAGLDGGGIWNGGSLNITDSTISDNWAQEGAAILNDRAGTLSLLNSTISANRSIAGTGAIRSLSADPIVIGNVTLLETAPRPDGYSGIFGAAEIRNTIIANGGLGSNCASAVTSLGHNLSSDNSCGLGGPGDLNNVQPQLTGLQHNGGPTLTHGLYPNSPAIDAGDNAACPATDQRGVARPQGIACDIGSYEYVTPPTAPPTEPPIDTPPPTDTATQSPTLAPTPRPKPSVSPSPSPTPMLNIGPTATSLRKPKPTYDAVLVGVPRQVPGVEEDAGGGVSPMAAGLASVGALGLLGSAASAGFFWYRRRRPRRR